MHLYIMRHGIAVEREEWSGPDEARPLTSEGRRKTKAIVKALRKSHDLSVEAIWTSPLTRANETAEIASEVLRTPVQRCTPLGEGATLDELGLAVKGSGEIERLLLVGHEPDLGFLLAGLMGEAEPRPFKKAGVAHLVGSFRRGGMKLQWHLAPKDILGE